MWRLLRLAADALVDDDIEGGGGGGGGGDPLRLRFRPPPLLPPPPPPGLRLRLRRLDAVARPRLVDVQSRPFVASFISGKQRKKNNKNRMRAVRIFERWTPKPNPEMSRGPPLHKGSTAPLGFPDLTKLAKLSLLPKKCLVSTRGPPPP